MTAPLDASLVRDIRAAGIPYEPEIDRLPFPVRHHVALTLALGHAVIAGERHWRWPRDALDVAARGEFGDDHLTPSIR